MPQVGSKLFRHPQEQSSSVGEDECRVLGCSVLVEMLKWLTKNVWLKTSCCEAVLLNEGVLSC